MSTDIQPSTDFTEAEHALIAQMGLTDVPKPHIQAFLHTAQTMHLDPRLKRDIALIARKSKNGGSTYTVQVGIAGYRKAARKIAKAEGETIKVDPWLFKGQDGEWVDTWDHKNGANYPLAAKATVYRDDMPFTQIIMWSEFAQMYGGKPMALWATKPTYMLGKTAESLAWRQAFPDEMGNTYEESEVQAIHMDASRADDHERGADAVRAALAAKKQQEPVDDVFTHLLASVQQADTIDKLKQIMNPEGERTKLTPEEDQQILDAADARLADLTTEGAQ